MSFTAVYKSHSLLPILEFLTDIQIYSVLSSFGGTE